MEKTQKPQKEHRITLKDRSDMELSGVCDVSSFSDTEIVLKTTCGALLIRGVGLGIGHLDTDTGRLCVKGSVTLMKYSKTSDTKFFEGLFR